MAKQYSIPDQQTFNRCHYTLEVTQDANGRIVHTQKGDYTLEDTRFVKHVRTIQYALSLLVCVGEDQWDDIVDSWKQFLGDEA